MPLPPPRPSRPAGATTLIAGRGGEALRTCFPGAVCDALAAPDSCPAERIADLVLADPAASRDTIIAWLAWAGRAGAAVWIPAALLPELAQAGITPQLVGATPFYHFRALRAETDRGAVAHLSPLLALLAMPIALPLLGLLALRVRLADGRPVLFAQKRIGYRGRRFTIYKFRTMRVTRMRPTRQVTRAGEWLRRHGLDELPQLFNLLSGSMSLIGPRPLPIAEHPHGDDGTSAWMAVRGRVMPGLTGLYQVCPGRRGLGLAEMCILDAYWLHNRSARLNARILLRTVAAVCGGWGR